MSYEVQMTFGCETLWISPEWKACNERSFRVRLVLIPEREGGLAHALCFTEAVGDGEGFQ